MVIAEAGVLDSANFMLTMDNKITLMNFYSSDSEKLIRHTSQNLVLSVIIEEKKSVGLRQ